MLPYHINKYPLFIGGILIVLQVLNVFLKMFPIAPQIYPILFGNSLTFMYINCKKGGQGKHDYDSILGEGSISRLLCLRSCQCSRNICDEPMNVALFRKKRKEELLWVQMKRSMDKNGDRAGCKYPKIG
jgi:hypothetical protein